MKNGVFYFNFVLEDEMEFDSDGEEYCLEIDYGFTFSCDNIGAIIGSDSWQHEVDRHENYFGVHDWSTSPNDKVNGIGYTSYEMTRDGAKDLMCQWRKYFISHPKFQNVGQVTELPDVNMTMDDLDIYNLVLAQHETV